MNNYTVINAASFTVRAVLGPLLARSLINVTVRDALDTNDPACIKELLVTFTRQAAPYAASELDRFCSFEPMNDPAFAQYTTPDGKCWQLGDGDDGGAVKPLADGCTFAIWLRALDDTPHSDVIIACDAFN